MKRILCMIITAVMLVTVFAPVCSIAKDTGHISAFLDVPNGRWYSSYAEYCYELGYISGTSSGYFSPESTLSRAMAVRILYSMSGEELETPEEETFSDVKKGKWYYTAVEWAFASGITKGTGDGNFNPDLEITRQDLTVMIFNYHCYLTETTPEPSEYSIEDMTDHHTVSGYALEGVRWAMECGMMTGFTDKTIRPKALITRAETVTLAAKYDESFGHSWYMEASVSQRSCTEDGRDVYRCSTCSVIRNVTLKSGHYWYRTEETKRPTCTENGYYTYKCETCGNTKQEALYATDHKWSVLSVTEPTYTTGGYTTYKCDNCGTQINENFTEPKKFTKDFPLMNTLQIGTQWSYEVYGGGNLIMTGCGIFATVNAIYNLNGSYFTPTQVATWAHNNGHYNVSGGEGTYDSLFSAFCKAFGPQYGFKYVGGNSNGSAYDQRLRDHILSGGTAIVHVPIHFMAVVGYDVNTGKYLIFDSAPGSGVSTPSRTRRGLTTPYGDWKSPAELSYGALKVDRYHLFSITD